MDIPKVNGNGKNWLTKGLLQVILILAAIAYIAVKEMSPGNTNKENERIARLEECIITLRPLPNEVAGMKVALDGVQKTVDKIEKNLDTHIDK